MFQHKSAPFKVANGYGWLVILSNRKHIEELQRAPDDLSLIEAFIDVSNCPVLLELIRIECRRQQFNARCTLGDEVVTAFDEVLDLRRYGGESIFTTVSLALISGTLRVEGCISIKCHPKGRLQDKQQTVRRPPIVYVFLPFPPCGS